MERVQRKKQGNYFPEEPGLDFVPSGCTLLDQVLGGGYPLGRVVNIVGDKSTGKTLLAIEAVINFLRKFPDGKIYYHEAEAAFDKNYAADLGMPVHSVTWIGEEGETEKEKEESREKSRTVEGFFNYLQEVIGEKMPSLYILDSLDSISDADELDREIDKGSYGSQKAKKMSEIFRRLVGKLRYSNVVLIIISQIRDKIGVMFGERHSRSGGKALDFYASQVLWLAEVKKIKKTVRKVERVIGVYIKAKIKKNKVGLPFRECEFPIIFGYGVDDIQASLDWLKVVGALSDLTTDSNPKNFVLGNPENKLELDEVVRKTWKDIEKNFIPKERKY